MANNLNPEEIERRTRETAEIVEDALRNISSQVGDIFQEALDNTSSFSKSLTNDITKGINSLAKSSTILISNQEKLKSGSLTRAQIEKQILDRNIKIKAIEQQINIAKKSGLITDEVANEQLNQALAYEAELISDLEEQARLADQFNKKLGVTGNVIKGLNKIPVLGGLINSEEVLARIQKKTAEEGSNRFDVFKEGIKGIGSSIKQSLTDPLVTFSALTTVAKFFLDAMFNADKRVTNIAKNLSISKEEAEGVYQSIVGSKSSMDTLYKTTENMVEAFNDISQLTEFATSATQDQIETQIILTKQLGQSKEEALGLQEIFAVNNIEAGKGVDIVYDQIAAFANQNKIIADGRKILQEISKTSKIIQLNFKGNVNELAKSVLEAKKLGLSLDQVSKIGNSLLNFEQSISSELEAELLLGKDINLEKARLYALNNDIAGLTKEIANQGITAEKFSKMNRIQQEAIAKVFGMQAEELADSLYKQELIRKTGGKELQQLKERAETLRKQKKDTEAINLERKIALIEQGILQGKQIEEAQKSANAQEKFTLAIERAKEIFSDLVDGGTLDKLVNYLDKFVGSLETGKSLLSTIVFGPASVTDIAVSRKQSFQEQLKTAPENQKKDLEAKIKEQNQIINNERQQKLKKQFEENPFSKLFGLKYEGGINTSSPSNKTSSPVSSNQQSDEVNKKLDKLISAVEKGGNVYLDGTKVGTAMAVGTYKIQ
jgi:hypothetical protein